MTTTEPLPFPGLAGVPTTDEKQTADALNAATSGPCPASGNRSRW